jgi:hypothetical protein
MTGIFEGRSPACERGGSACRAVFHPSMKNICSEATVCNYFFAIPEKCTIFNDSGKSATLSETASIPGIPRFFAMSDGVKTTLRRFTYDHTHV